MPNRLDQLKTQELEAYLLNAYAEVYQADKETEAVQALKTELYRRGVERDEIVRIALAALIRQSMN